MLQLFDVGTVNCLGGARRSCGVVIIAGCAGSFEIMKFKRSFTTVKGFKIRKVLFGVVTRPAE